MGTMLFFFFFVPNLGWIMLQHLSCQLILSDVACKRTVIVNASHLTSSEANGPCKAGIWHISISMEVLILLNIRWAPHVKFECKWFN